MEKCPKCKRYTISYDSYRKVKRCLADGCSCIIVNKVSYSYLKSDSCSNTINRVKIQDGTEKIIKRYKAL